MFLQYLFFLTITWITSQTLKLIFKTYKIGRTFKKRELFLYYSGPPSTHAAVLTMNLLYIQSITKLNSPVFLSVVIFTILWLYEILMQRKRFTLLMDMIELKKGKEADVLRNREFHGHELLDISAGILLGAILFFLLRFILY